MLTARPYSDVLQVSGGPLSPGNGFNARVEAFPPFLRSPDSQSVDSDEQPVCSLGRESSIGIVMILITPDTIHTRSYLIQFQFQNPPISAIRVMSSLRLSSYAASRNRNPSRNLNLHSCHSCSVSTSTFTPPSQNQSPNQSLSDHGGGTHQRPRHPLTGPANLERVRARASTSTGAAVLTVTTTTTTTTTIDLVQRVDRVTRSPPAESGSRPLTLTPSGGTHTRRVTAPPTVLVTLPTQRLPLETTTARLNRAAAARVGIARRIGEEMRGEWGQWDDARGDFGLVSDGLELDLVGRDGSFRNEQLQIRR